MLQGKQHYQKILDSRQGELSVLSDKTIGLVVLSVYAVYTFTLFKFLEPNFIIRKKHLAEFVITLHLLCFFGFFVSFPRNFFPGKRAIIKGIVLCGIIPFACCAMVYTTFYVTYIIDWKLPPFRTESIGSAISDLIVNFSGLPAYLTLAVWLVSLPLLAIFCICTYTPILRMYSPGSKIIHSPLQKAFKASRCIKFVLLTGVTYIVFAIGYVFTLKSQHTYYSRIFDHGALLYIFSFLSIFYILPSVDNIKKAIAYCLIIPVFWPVFIGTIYTILILEDIGFLVI